MKAKSAISAKIFSRKTLYGLCIEIDNSAYFWRRHNRFHKNNYTKKAPKINRIFRHMKNILWSHLNIDEKFLPHFIMQILCYYGNTMNMFQRKFLKLQCKKTASKEEEIIRLHSDSLRFFQSSFSEFFT